METHVWNIHERLATLAMRLAEAEARVCRVSGAGDMAALLLVARRGGTQTGKTLYR